MKNARFIIVTIFVLASAGAFFAFRTPAAPNSDSGVIIIRTFQQFTSESVMHIYYGNAKFEEVKLEKLRADSQHRNWDVIMNTINKFYADGYHLVSSTERGENSINSTFILSKN